MLVPNLFFVSQFVLASLFIALHAVFLLGKLSVMDVATSSRSTTLLGLIILVQFAEMKSTAMKQFTLSRLAQVVS